MSISLPLNNEQKLTVTYRIEPGCLGPQGSTYVDDFCQFAQEKVVDLDADFIHWNITPRSDKKLNEMEYSVNNKQLTHDKADWYLKLFNKSLDEFEEHIQDKCVALINQFFER